MSGIPELPVDFDKLVKLFTGEHASGLRTRQLSTLKRLVRLNAAGCVSRRLRPLLCMSRSPSRAVFPRAERRG